MLTRAAMEWFWDHYLHSPEDGASPYASPLRAASLDGLPPAVVATAEFDPLRDEGRAYARRLAEAGVQVTENYNEGQVHDFFLLGAAFARTARLTAEIGAVLRKELGS